MRKIAVFLEGQTELITTREFLLKKYSYVVNIDCFQQFKEGNTRPVEYSYKCPFSEVYYELINVGNDQKVLSAILEREKSIFLNGYEKIIGLRDMYSKVYRELSNGIIDQELNFKIITNDQETIRKKSVNSSKIFFCFSIMEIESWFLGIQNLFLRLHQGLSVDFIRNRLNFDLSIVDPEFHFFHPAKTFSDIFELQNLSYDKRKGDIEAICKHMTIEDFSDLYNSPKCKSFNLFCDRIS